VLRLCSRLAAWLLPVALIISGLAVAAPPVAAAEVLQVRSATLLQVGDSNRSYTVELACMAPIESERDQALAWLRQQLPRRTRVNLRPIGNHDGILVARVQKLGADQDLSSGLIEIGYAERLTEPAACR